MGGSHRLSTRMAEELGEAVALSAPVRRIDQDADGVSVVADGRMVRARFAIVALAPAVVARIDHHPALPAARLALEHGMPQGAAMKCMAIYERLFWREDGLSGHVTSDRGPVKFTFDNSPPDGSPGVMLGFLEGNEARRLARVEPDRRRTAVIGCLVRHFGAAASSPDRYLESSWSEDPWTLGCYSGHMPPGGWTSHGAALRAPVGRVHWAGTEAETRWNGSMDGAISAGERAGDEALARLAAGDASARPSATEMPAPARTPALAG